MRLLRAGNGGYILHFLHNEFKREQQIAVGHEQLQADLAEFQEAIRVEDPEALPGEAGDYLNAWCKSEVRFLQRYFPGGSDEPVYQLTSHTEAALRFVRETLPSEGQAIGAESRMQTIVESLRELSVFGRDDVDGQVELLERERDRIQARIDRIRQRGEVERPDPALVREKFHFVLDLLQRVMGDFRRVEDQFKEITREVQDRQMAGDHKGGLLEFVLDAESILKESDAGKSFYGFVNLILSPGRQETLRRMVDAVHEVDALEGETENLSLLRFMMPALTAEAEQVMQTNQRLSASIARFLDGRVADERRKVAMTMDEIFRYARQNRQSPPENVELAVDAPIRVFPTFSRPFWSPSAEVAAMELNVDATSGGDLEDSFDLFVEMVRLDWKGMRERIAEAVKREASVSLPGLLERHPPRNGVVEILAYVQLAEEGGHLVEADESDEVSFEGKEGGGAMRRLEVPRVVFRRG